MAVDTAGNVYVADSENHLIRKISPAGDVSTLAGSGANGANNATGTAATFRFPTGVAVDTAGNVYVADLSNHLIRKITPTGTVSTLAGNAGISGAINATGTAASFDTLHGVAVDTAGNVYVADSENHLIRKISPAGDVSTLAGSGANGANNATGTAATFRFPTGVAVDTAGNVYVADLSNHLIRKITPTGVVTTLAGTVGVFGSADGNGTNATFNLPAGVAVDTAGNVYVADSSNQLIRKISPAGDVTTLAGTAGATGSTNGTGAAARFNNPLGVAVNTDDNVYVADGLNHLIRKIN